MGKSVVGYFVLLCAIVLCFGAGVLANPLGLPDSEYNALVALYNSTGGDQWTHNDGWFSDSPDWYGVAFTYDMVPIDPNDPYGPYYYTNVHVTTISMPGNNLVGHVPVQLANISGLQTLDLGSNHLSGSIPVELCNLHELSSLVLSANMLSGTIPSEIGNLTNLVTLELAFNQLEGEIPHSITSLVNIMVPYTHSHFHLEGNKLQPPDPEIIDFLDSKNCGYIWQTVPPKDVMAAKLGNDVQTKWTRDSSLGSYYEVGYSYVPGGPYTFDPANRTAGPDSSLVISGLDTTRPVYTTVRTVTLPFIQNQSTLTSVLSTEAEAAPNPLRIDAAEYDALVALYNATDGPNWTYNTNWLTFNPNWFGVYLADGHVSFLILELNNLVGTIPPGIGSLTSAEEITFAGNKLSGQIPAELGNLSDISILYLDDNQLTGPIPPELANLRSVNYLGLSGNQFFGEAPSWITSLPMLQYVGLSYNALQASDPVLDTLLGAMDYWWPMSQTLPPSDISISHQGEDSVTVSWTPIPFWQEDGYYEVGYSLTQGGPYTFDPTNRTMNKTASSLTISGLDLSQHIYYVVRTVSLPNGRNHATLTSVLSPEAAYTNALGLPQSEYDALVALYNSAGGPNWTNNTNWLTENPDWFGVTVWDGHVTCINLESNNLAGPLPAELSNLTYLNYLYLGPNQLTGPIPPELGSLTNLRTLFLRSNQLTGTIPEELGSLTNLGLLDLCGNSLSGPIPPELGDLKNLYWLVLDSNQLTGPIPAELGGLTSLQRLHLSYNQLSGSIPAELGNLTNLQWLNLMCNYLSGPIPPELGNLANLSYLDLGWNQLTGSIPTQLANLSNLYRMWLNDNHISGPIPPELGNLANMMDLYLYDNQLSGPIPPELGDLVNLQYLQLCGNQLSGEVPSSIANLINMSWMDIGYNALSCSDPAVLSYLAQYDSYWQQTQTVPPTNVTACNPGAGSASLTWSPIEFNYYDGYYEVGYGATSGGPYTFDPANRTADKMSSSLSITGLSPGQPAYFAVRTVSLPNYSNQSTLISAESAEAATTSTPFGLPDSEYNALVALYNSTDGPNWTNNTNWLTANPNWYGVTVENSHVTSVYLNCNNLSGNLPPQLGNLTELEWFDLSGNQLTGEIPSSIANLDMLMWADLGYNALSCSDPDVVSHLASTDPDWQYTQTVPPTELSAWRGSDGSANISWRPVAFSQPQGYYEVGYSYASGGPYNFDPANRTSGKWSEQLKIDGLDPSRTAYLVVRTVTLPHFWNQSTLTSVNSEEVSAEVLVQGSKQMADGTSVLISGIMTAAFDDCCYVEAENRTWGIRAESPYGNFPDPGTKVEAYGTLRTNSDGERYLEVDNGDETGSGSVAPIYMANRNLGGADWKYNATTGTGQKGVTGGTGLNNIGLLVRTTGSCTYIDDHTFTISDGSEGTVTCETPSTMLVSPAWQCVTVTGISSIKKTNDTYGRILRVTEVNPVTSAPPEGVTGRWEATSTSGNGPGVVGILLVQRGTTVTGSLRGAQIADGQMNGDVFTMQCSVFDAHVVSSLTLSGDTLTGTWSVTQPSGPAEWPVEFHRVSPDPVSPYTGRPKVVAANCNGWSINVTWDRPINGWNYDIRTQNGQNITDWSEVDYNLTYNPSTHVFHIPLHTTTPLVPGEKYTIYLDGQGDNDPVNWHDPYGVAAWDWAGDCYSFEFTYHQLPPAPSLALGYRTSGMPAQWVTISASWPQGYGLKLYQSADMINWQSMALTPTRRGGNGDFTFELWSNAYFFATTVGSGTESYPSPIVHARPFEIETSGIVIDTPVEGATGVPLTPLISWHPAWSQSVTVGRYGPKVIDVATGNIVWSPLTTANPPQTSLIYGQTSSVMAMPATPLVTGKNYAIRLGAFDDENWMFATTPERHFTTTTTSGGTAEEDAIRALYESIKNAIEARDVDALMVLFSADYLHNGTDRATQRSYMEEGLTHVTGFTYDITNISITGNKASVAAAITVTFDNQSPISWTEPSSGDDGLGMGWLIQENGQWLVYGNQTRGQIELHTVRGSDGSCGLRFQAYGAGLVSGTVIGPNIGQATLYWDASWSDFRQWVVPSQTPQIGDVYTYDLYYGDGRHETINSSVGSIVPVCPSVSANVQLDGSIALDWEDISAQVPGASYYWVCIMNEDGYRYVWSSDELSLNTTTFTTPPMMPGTYRCELYIFDDLDDTSTSAVSVTIAGGPPPPPT